jgi:hypothetical protein
MQQGLIVIPVSIEGPSGVGTVQLGLDTGSTSTLIGVSHLVIVGYDPSQGTPTQILTSSGLTHAARLTVTRLSALGQSRPNFSVIAHTLPHGPGIDGLLGLDFFAGTALTIDFRSGQIDLN